VYACRACPLVSQASLACYVCCLFFAKAQLGGQVTCSYGARFLGHWHLDLSNNWLRPRAQVQPVHPKVGTTVPWTRATARGFSPLSATVKPLFLTLPTSTAYTLHSRIRADNSLRFLLQVMSKHKDQSMDAIGRDAGSANGLDSRRDGRSWLSVRPSEAWILQGEGLTSDSNERLVTFHRG
jgi:hypothetical protein